MSDDIIERLNQEIREIRLTWALEIEALRAENARLIAENEELRKSKMGRLAWYKMRDEEDRAAMGETE